MQHELGSAATSTYASGTSTTRAGWRDPCPTPPALPTRSPRSWQPSPAWGGCTSKRYAEIQRAAFDAMFLEIQAAGSTIGALGANTNGVATTITVPDGSLYNEDSGSSSTGRRIDAREGWGYGVPGCPATR